MDTLTRAMDWLTNSNDTGISSKAIMAKMLGGPIRDNYCHPHDPADLGRCLRLLDRIPEWKPRIAEMGSISTEWKAISESWSELEHLFLEECGSLNPAWGTKAPKTYARMRALQDAPTHPGSGDV